MKSVIALLTISFTLFIHQMDSQNVSINEDGSLPDPSAILDLKSNNKGLLIPRMKTADRTSISGAVRGLLVFDLDTESFWYHDGFSWLELMPAVKINYIQDNDADTKVMVEKNPDDDQIHFEMGGAEYFTMDKGRLEVHNATQSIFFGAGAGVNSTSTIGRQIAIGDSALLQNTIGRENTAVGYRSMRNNQTGSINTAIGVRAMFKNTSAWYNTAVGYEALYSNNASGNTALGRGVLYFNTDGISNTGAGDASLHLNETGDYNSAMGAYSLFNNTSGSYNIANGQSALYNNTSGSHNTAVGSNALYLNTTGHSNVAIGVDALRLNTERSNLIAIGDSALYYNSFGGTGSGDGAYNLAIGSKALMNNTVGHHNISIGLKSMYNNLQGHNNIAIGETCLFQNDLGTSNIAIGYDALFSNISGSGNVVIGRKSGYDSDGSNNVMVGNNAGENSNGSGNIFIGSFAGFDAIGDNKLYIANSLDFFPLIYGDFQLEEVGINGQVGISTPYPAKELHIVDGDDVDDHAVIRMQSKNANNDAIIQLYENTVPAMSMHYSGSANAFYLVDLTQNPDTVRVTFKRNGDVGIANQNPTHKLDVGTNGAFCDGGVWVNGSSREYKTSMLPLSSKDAYEAFHQMIPYRYRYIDNPEEEYIGFIAEDVPQLVAINDRKGISSMDVVAMLTKVVQEQEVQIIEQNKQLEMLKEELIAIREAIQALKSDPDGQ